MNKTSPHPSRPGAPEFSPAPSAFNGAHSRIQPLTPRLATRNAIGSRHSLNRLLASPGAPLQSHLRQEMSQRFGHDFSRVRVHHDATAEQSTREFGAKAFTVGDHIAFRAGQFSPETLTPNISDAERLVLREAIEAVESGNVVRAVTNANIAPDSRLVTGLTDRLRDEGIEFIDVMQGASP